MAAHFTPDYLVDRRALRRKLSLWRIVALVAAGLGVIGIAVAASGGGSRIGLPEAHITRVSLDGVLTGDDATVKLLRDVAKSSAAGVIVRINSPGGTTAGSERLFTEIRKLAEKKPVVAQVGALAASGGYIAAMAADGIIAEGNSIVGSIGVIFQYPNVTRLMETVGVKMEEIKSSPLKAAPNPFEPTSPAARAAMEALVADSYAWFKTLVRERRNLADSELAQVSDGRVFTGRQGLGLKLVDALGGEREAVAWLEANKGVAKDLPVRDRKPDRTLNRLGLASLASIAAEAAGFDALAQALRRAGETGASNLDGLVSIWQVPSP